MEKSLRPNLFPTGNRFAIVRNLLGRCSAKQKYHSRPGTRYGMYFTLFAQGDRVGVKGNNTNSISNGI